MLAVVKVYVCIEAAVLNLNNVIHASGEDIVLEGIEVFFDAIQIVLHLKLTLIYANTSVT